MISALRAALACAAAVCAPVFGNSASAASPMARSDRLLSDLPVYGVAAEKLDNLEASMPAVVPLPVRDAISTPGTSSRPSLPQLSRTPWSVGLPPPMAVRPPWPASLTRRHQAG